MVSAARAGGGGALTEDVSLVEAVGGDDCRGSVWKEAACRSDNRSRLTRHAQVGLGREVGHGVSGASDAVMQVVGLSCRRDVKAHTPTVVGCGTGR